jgi:cytochrome c peroxidase
MRLSNLCIVLLAATGALAQSSYNAAHRWWEPNQDEQFPWDSEYDNPSGWLRVSNPKGSFRTGGHPFFRPLGANGRACITCHQPSNAMSLSVENIRSRWAETGGKDPLFAAVDGSNCPTLPQDQRSSHSLLLDRGLFRVGLKWPPEGVTPDFRLEVLSDPTGCNARPGEISVYRRPRMSANLTTLVEGPHGKVLMADGRAPTLRDQAIDAALVHMEAAAAPSEDDLRRILDFETQVTAAQHADVRGGLTADFSRVAEGPVGQHRDSVRRGARLFADRCASCHQPGSTRWKALPPVAVAPELPVFQVTCQSGKTLTTQDPGRALISGKCADVGAIVIPQFHGLAARAPYFSNGSAATLEALVDSYRERLGIRFTGPERSDLVNYLSSL